MTNNIIERRDLTPRETESIKNFAADYSTTIEQRRWITSWKTHLTRRWAKHDGLKGYPGLKDLGYSHGPLWLQELDLTTL
jgi:hypothetical protein